MPEKIENLLREIILADMTAINGIIMTEVLSGILKTKEYDMVSSDFKGFHYLEITEDVFSRASLMGSALRRKGITVPATDLIIASSAIISGCAVYHMDSHFDVIAKNTELKAKNLLA